MSDLKRFCVEIPHFERRYLNGDYYRLRPDDYDKLKSQIEAVNALLDSAEPHEIVTKCVSGFLTYSESQKGYFIPMPEEPDSLEKLVKDLAEHHHEETPETGVYKLIARAKRLTTKEGE